MTHWHFHYHLFTEWLHINPQWGGLAAFLIAFSESIAIIGTIIPGSVTMTAIGILAGSGVLPLWEIIMSAVIGAFLGDGTSYLLGYYLKNKIQNYWPFSRHPKLLITGQEFFLEHGGKSIILGRFIGPIRAIIPVIAGTFKFPPKRYFISSGIASICWAPIYMLPGILLGAVSLEMPVHVATELIAFVLVLLIIIWLVIWLTRYLYKKTHRYFNIKLNQLWENWVNKPSKQWICYLLRYGNHSKQRGQLLLGCVFALFLFLFFIVFLNVIFHGPLIHLNNILYHLFRGVRTSTLDKFFTVVSSIGIKDVILPTIVIIALWLLINRKINASIHWLLNGFLAAGAVFVFKTLLISPRPPGIFENSAGYSFPSGHTVMSTIFYGLLAFLFTRNLSKIARRVIIWLAVFICTMVAISRLYLGDHWFTDVLGGLFLGLTILTFAIISYRRYTTPKINKLSLLIVTLIAFVAIDAHYVYHHYNTNLYNTKPFWKTYTISELDWWNQQSPLIPSYRTDRFGFPDQLLNIQWAGPLDEIQATLKQHGWKNLLTRSYLATLKKLAQEHISSNQALFPKLFNDKPPVLSLIKFPYQHSPELILLLWQSNIHLAPRDLQLWVGTVYFDPEQKTLLFFQNKHYIKPQRPAYNYLLHDFVKYTWQIKVIPPTRLPKKIRKKQLFTPLVIAIRPYLFNSQEKKND